MLCSQSTIYGVKMKIQEFFLLLSIVVCSKSYSLSKESEIKVTAFYKPGMDESYFCGDQEVFNQEIIAIKKKLNEAWMALSFSKDQGRCSIQLNFEGKEKVNDFNVITCKNSSFIQAALENANISVPENKCIASKLNQLVIDINRPDGVNIFLETGIK